MPTINEAIDRIFFILQIILTLLSTSFLAFRLFPLYQTVFSTEYLLIQKEQHKKEQQKTEVALWDYTLNNR